MKERNKRAKGNVDRRDWGAWMMAHANTYVPADRFRTANKATPPSAPPPLPPLSSLLSPPSSLHLLPSLGHVTDGDQIRFLSLIGNCRCLNRFRGRRIVLIAELSSCFGRMDEFLLLSIGASISTGVWTLRAAFWVFENQRELAFNTRVLWWMKYHLSAWICG